jgi:hypothetical protein
MPDTSLNGKLGRIGGAVRYSALPIAIVAAAIGWLLVTRAERPRELAKRVRTAGEGARQRLNYAGELARGLGGYLVAETTARNTAAQQGPRKKVLTDEPMAGYGA